MINMNNYDIMWLSYEYEEEKGMKEKMIVRGAPQEYICEVGAWDKLETHLIERRITNVLILHGEKSWEIGNSFFPQLKQITSHFKHYKNECSFENMSIFNDYVNENKIDGVIAVGGGKVLDLGKLVAYECQIDCICLPTLASTCAAFTPVSVIYNRRGEMIDMKFFSRSISLTLIDPEVILHSPKEYLIAGIGDTLAKWYESDPVISKLNSCSVEISVAKFAAKQCQENLLSYGIKAINDLENNILSDDFIKIVETNILLAGMVGGFGDKYGRTSGAHSIHDALTFLPETHNYLHGNKVAYGILVQLAIEGKWEEIKKLVVFYEEVGLPYSFSQLDISLSDLDIIAEISAKDELIHLLPQFITEKVIKDAMVTLN